ncbi:hypothetical protein J2847_005853 [Azospirillum agricola]|uniref:hypothetical protein n=1 Tax=Azospirillum agricola TaxID=1720247 RepID=UPI001AE51F4E|nr:hypothetical protein [Azospirillum agricola]MBP2232524.1 hypothetical protein [Azospirillum agricola]
MMPISTDMGTPERALRSEGIVVEARSISSGGMILAEGARVKAENGLERLFLRCQIVDRQFQAGMRFRALFAQAAMPAQMTSSYGQRRGGGGGREEEADARNTMRKAMVGAKLAVERKDGQPLRLTTTGETLQPVGGGVCVTPAGAAVMEAAGLDGDRYRLQDLRAGLSALADYWRIETED